MPSATIAAINTIWLAAGLALVLWGLRIFRFWVGTVGLIAGGLLGAAAGGAATGSEQAAIMGAVVGGAIGLVAAWPLQRLMMALTAGGTMAVIAAAGAVVLSGSGNVAGIAIAAFFIGGFLGLLLNRAVIIAAMAFTGALAVFHALYVPADAFIGSPEQIAGRLLSIYAAEYVVLLATTAVFTAFALWYQSGPSRRRDRTPVEAARALAARRVSTRLAFALLAAWVVAAVFIAIGLWPVSVYELVGLHPLSWPVVSLAAILPLSTRPIVIQLADGDLRSQRPRRRHRLHTAAAFAAIVPPVLTAALFVALGGSWDGLIDYYRAFLAGPGPVVATKWAFSLGLMPLLLLGAQPVVYMPPPPAPADQEETGTDPEEAGLEAMDEDADSDVVAYDLDEDDMAAEFDWADEFVIGPTTTQATAGTGVEDAPGRQSKPVDGPPASA